MEASSVVPKIVRWRVYLQSFSFVLRHIIPGHKNSVADYLSRMYDEDVSASTTLAVIEEDRGVWSTEKAKSPVSELLFPSNDHCLPFDPISETNLD
jgi:hypothetical protein